jgi:hypothetical protein
MAKNEDWSFTRNPADSPVNKLIRNRISDDQDSALRKTPHYVCQTLLHQCSIYGQTFVPHSTNNPTRNIHPGTSLGSEGGLAPALLFFKRPLEFTA